MRQLQDDADLADLMAAAQSGDSAAYKRLLLTIIPVLRQTVRQQNRGLQPSDVEDLVQEALLSIHLVRTTFDASRPFLPWAKTIARNRAIDWARRDTRKRANEAADAPPPETFAAEETNNSDDAPGDPEALQHAIARLPNGQRRAVELLKLREMSLREASEATGTSISALKVACHRGIKALRATLAAGS